jgi:hypothetical protein
MNDTPTRWLYVIAVLVALMPNMDRLCATPLGAALWFGALFAFSWPFIRFGRAWIAVTIGAIAAGASTYLMQQAPTIPSAARFALQLATTAVLVVLSYFVLIRGYQNPYKKPRD